MLGRYYGEFLGTLMFPAMFYIDIFFSFVKMSADVNTLPKVFHLVTKDYSSCAFTNKLIQPSNLQSRLGQCISQNQRTLTKLFNSRHGDNVNKKKKLDTCTNNVQETS